MNWMSRRMVRWEVSSSAASAEAEGKEPDLMRWWMRRRRSQWIFDFRDEGRLPCLIFDLDLGMGEVSLKWGKRQRILTSEKQEAQKGEPRNTRNARKGKNFEHRKKGRLLP